MTNEDTREEDTSHEEEEEEVEVGDEDTQNLSDEMRKKVNTLLFKKKHWRDQAIDPETGKKWKDIVAEQRESAKETTETPKQPSADDDFDQIVSITKSVQDLSDTELQELKKLSTELGVPAKTLVTSSAWSARKAQLRAENKQDEPVPDTSRRSSGKQSKSWSEMSKAERKANFAQQTERHRRRE